MNSFLSTRSIRNIISSTLVFLIFLSFGLGKVKAVLGPVHVELNITNKRMGPARANTVTAFKIYMRINEDIHTHHWVKVWFPVEEASDDLEDVCGEEFVIKGYDESPRFVPNEKYFEKYDNPEEERVGKLYEILDEYEVITDFYDCSDLCDDDKHCRLVEDPSGLGCWIMGTVMPSLPRDKSDRKEKASKIIHSTAPGGCCPCSECMGYPIMIQDADGCLFQFFSPVHVEAWRQGYNPIDLINTSQTTGIIAPATPGRYKLRVATEPEPTPVESDAFVLPCSQISNLSVICTPSPTNENVSITIDFDVGEGGALDAGSSIINIIFPKEFTLPEAIKPSAILVNGKQLKVAPMLLKDTNTIKLVSSMNINNLGHATILIHSRAGISKPPESRMYAFSASTSSEPEPVSCTQFIGTPGEYVWQRTPENVKERILRHENLPVKINLFDHETANEDEMSKYRELIDNLSFIAWGRRPEIHYNFTNSVFPTPIYREGDYLLTYYKGGDESPTAFLGPDCCHFEPGFSAYDPFDPRKAIPYPGFVNIFPYCDVMIKSWRQCSIHCATAKSASNYMLGIVGGNQCASNGCKKIRYEHDVYFLFIPSVEFNNKYTRAFNRFGEIYPVEFKKMLPTETLEYTNTPGSVFLYEHDYKDKSFNLSVGKTPGDFVLHHELEFDYNKWRDWVIYVCHMKPNGR